MYECFHCLHKTVGWDCDYSFEDFGYAGEDIVQICHCSNCGAEIEYRIPIEVEDDLIECTPTLKEGEDDKDAKSKRD